MVLSNTPKNLIGCVWLLYGLGLKDLIYVHLHGCFHVCYVLFCHVMYQCFVCILYACIRIYVYVYLYVCIYMYAHLCTYILVSMYVVVHTFICIKVICLSCRYLGCYLLVWHCYLGSILAFSFEFQNLNTIICIKTSNNST